MQVSAELAVRLGDGGLLRASLLELDDGERQAVHVQDDVEAAAEPLLLDADLLHRQPLVLGRRGAQQTEGRGLLQPGGVGVREPAETVNQVVVERLVLADRVLGLGLQDVGRRLQQVLVGDFWVEAAEGGDEVVVVDQVSQGGTLVLNLGAGGVPPAHLAQPVDHRGFPLRFGNHVTAPPLRWRPRPSPGSSHPSARGPGCRGVRPMYVPPS